MAQIYLVKRRPNGDDFRGCETAKFHFSLTRHVLQRSREKRRKAIKESFTLQHGSICSVGDGKDMRRNFVAFDALISLHNLFGVDWKLLVRIDDDAEKS